MYSIIAIDTKLKKFALVSSEFGSIESAREGYNKIDPDMSPKIVATENVVKAIKMNNAMI